MIITVRIEDVAVSVASENEEDINKIIAKTLALWKKTKYEEEVDNSNNIN